MKVKAILIVINTLGTFSERLENKLKESEIGVRISVAEIGELLETLVDLLSLRLQWQINCQR